MDTNIYTIPDPATITLKIPKVIAEIVICGACHIAITEGMDWMPSTTKQRENLKKLLNIEVFEYGDKTEER